MIAAVFDTNIFLQAILSETGPANACLEELFAGRIVYSFILKFLQKLTIFSCGLESGKSIARWNYLAHHG